MHDIGLGAWFGGSLMGAVGLNGAAASAKDPKERTRISANGWGMWMPWQVGAIAVHGIGAIGLVITNRSRLKVQQEAQVNSVVKTVLTLGAAGISLYSGYLGLQVKKHEDEGAAGATEPGVGSSPELTSAQKQLKVLQWVIPVLSGSLFITGAQQGEQQREPAGILDKLKGH